ncbi:hypothetical protein FRB95_011486 [Tulasnella sp. JGI-2019a]|nr:hypothetical protein FRB95_011486 [Tulasnella sp. JGI-2019a]
MSEPLPVIANPFMAVAATAAAEPAAVVAHPDTPAVPGETHESFTINSPTATGQPGSNLSQDRGFQESTEPGEVGAGLPPNLDPSTRPSLAIAPGVEQVSYVAQASSTPTQELPVHPPESTPPGAVTRQEENVDPRVATLQAMFPDIDVSILQLILEESGGDTDTAIEALLAMSDPDYRPQPHAHAQQQRQPSVIDLDEQLAQRLQLEEEEAQQREESRQPAPRRYEGLGMHPPIGQGGQYPNQNMTQSRQNAAGMGAGGGDIATTFKNFLAGASAKVSATGFGRGGGGNSTGDYNADRGQNQGQGQQGQGPDYRQQFMEVAESE